ncbi:MAG: lipopolysaccharide biosynthesis protein [Elainellaceae cyanobacterium]
MNLGKELINFLQRRVLSNNFIKNIGWLGGAQVINRVTRLLTTVVLARTLTPEDFGLAALVLTTYDFTRILTMFGIGGKIIRSDDEELEEICNGAYWLNWLIFLTLFCIQIGLAFPIAKFYGNDRLILPICTIAIVYLISPFGRIQSILVQRENRLKVTALSHASTLASSNIITAALALSGLGLWAIVLPKLVTPFIEIYIYLRHQPWRPSGGFTTQRWGEIFNFGINIMGINLLKTLRENGDYLIIGRFLGVEELGKYFFAFNAGLGISLTIIQSITVALYPHLCAARLNFDRFKETYFKSLKTIAMIIIPFVILQSSLASFYVPIIFGSEWVTAIPILIRICLSAIPRPFEVAANQLLNSIDKPYINLRWSVIFTVLFCGALLIGVQGQSIGVATAVLVVHWVFPPMFTVWATWYVFYRKVGYAAR